MFSRGQAALEYLMTYGWALIVVALAVGILVFIAQPPGSTFRCNSSDPNILVKGHDFPQYSSGSGGSRWGETCGDWQIWEGTIVLQNATGKNIEIVDAITEGYFFTFMIGEDHMCILPSHPIYGNFAPIVAFSVTPLPISAGQTFEIVPTSLEGICDSPLSQLQLITTFTDWSPPFGSPRLCGGSGGAASFDTLSGQIVLTYLDQFGLQKDVTISCSGFPERN